MTTATIPKTSPAIPTPNMANDIKGSPNKTFDVNRKMKATLTMPAQFPVFVLGSTSIFFIFNNSLHAENICKSRLYLTEFSNYIIHHAASFSNKYFGNTAILLNILLIL
jgi:hypothetical protein